MSLCLSGSSTPQRSGRLAAHAYASGFALAHDTYNGISAASDGRIYYVLCSEQYDTAGQMYVFDPATRRVQHLADLTEISGEKGKRVVAQGKSHVRFVESDGKLYFATHIGYYSTIDGMEKVGIPPEGWGAYPGGHLLSYDMRSGSFEDLAIAPNGEGILTMNMDTHRKRIYYLTWPAGRFYRFDIATKQTKDLGAFFLDGENGVGARYRTICRALAIDSRDGCVYFTDGEGTIHRYRPEEGAVERVAGDDLRKDYFGLYDPSSAGHMAYHWRQVFWHSGENTFYGVHGNSGYLFRFDPVKQRVELLDRITSMLSKRSGMFDQFSYGYLGLEPGPDGRTIYYLTGGPVYVGGKRVRGRESTAKGESKGTENLHLITWDIPDSRYVDHGPIFFENGDRPSYVNSIAVGADGTVYTLSRVPADGKIRTDLVEIRK